MGNAATISRMISPVSGHFAQYSSSVEITNARQANTGSAGMRSGRASSAAVRRSVIALIGPVMYEMIVATEITAASLPQPRKKNRNTNETARLNHIAGRGTPQTG